MNVHLTTQRNVTTGGASLGSYDTDTAKNKLTPMPERYYLDTWQERTVLMLNSKQKGKRGELELVHKLQHYGFNTRRSVQYNGKTEDGQADLVGLPNIHIECKRVEKLNLYDAIAQAKRDAKTEELPTVFHRKNDSEWLVTMRLDDWIELYKKYEEAEV